MPHASVKACNVATSTITANAKKKTAIVTIMTNPVVKNDCICSGNGIVGFLFPLRLWCNTVKQALDRIRTCCPIIQPEQCNRDINYALRTY